MADESRFEYLEGRVEEQSRNWDRLFELVGRIDQKINMVAVALSARFDARCDAIESRFDKRCDGIEAKFDAVDQKLDRKFDDLRLELSKQFRWTMGVMVTLATGVLTAVLTR